MSKAFILPAWFNRFVSKPAQDDLERRTSLTGTASRTKSYLFGLIEVEVRVTNLDHAASAGHVHNTMPLDSKTKSPPNGASS